MQALSNEELRAVLSAARVRRERDWLLFLLMFWHGLRASEAVNLTRKDVEGGFISVHRLKGSLKTTQPLIEHPDPLFNERGAVPVFVRNLQETQRLFPISRVQVFRLFRRCAIAAGLPEHKRHDHVLKHSGAFAVLPAGIENARQWLGHKSLDSTGEYLKVSDEQAAAAVAPVARSKVI